MAQPAADVPPGLPGAPVRTPVRATGAATGPALWPALAGRLLSRQLWVELYGLPGYALTLRGGGKTAAFAASPRDPRPHEPTLGKLMLGGRLTLAGASLDLAPGADPFNRICPTKAFAIELHEFGWLPSLMLNGERGAREAVRLTQLWQTGFSRWSPFAWAPEILARRVFNLAAAARRMGQVCAEADRLTLSDLLARQARQLLRPPGSVADRATRLTAAAVAGCVLSGPVGARLRARALARLGPALTQTVAGDGLGKGRAEPGQGAGAQAGPDGAAEHAAGHGGGGQAGGAVGDGAGRAQQLARLAGQQVGQGQPVGLGADLAHAAGGGGEVEDPAGEDLGGPGEGRPAAEAGLPQLGQAHRLARAALAIEHQRGQPAELVQLDGEGLGRADAVEGVGPGGEVEAGSGQGQAAAEHQLAEGRLMRPRIARAGGEGGGLAAAAQGQGVAGQAVELHPQLARQQAAGEGGPQGRAGGRAGGPHRGADRGAGQARGDVRGRLRHGQAVPLRAAMLAA